MTRSTDKLCNISYCSSLTNLIPRRRRHKYVTRDVTRMCASVCVCVCVCDSRVMGIYHPHEGFTLALYTHTCGLMNPRVHTYIDKMFTDE